MGPVSVVTVDEVLRGVHSDEDLMRQTLLRKAGAGLMVAKTFKGVLTAGIGLGKTGVDVIVPNGVRWVGRTLISCGEDSHVFTLQTKKPADAGFVDRVVAGSDGLAAFPLRLFEFEFEEGEQLKVLVQRVNLGAYNATKNVFQTLTVMEVKL